MVYSAFSESPFFQLSVLESAIYHGLDIIGLMPPKMHLPERFLGRLAQKTLAK
jgi:hypothetical protein